MPSGSKPPATAEQKQAYLDAGGVRCLFCRDYNISAEKSKMYGVVINQRVFCPACQRTWVDVYSLTGTEPDEDE
jgi:transposase-like protein